MTQDTEQERAEFEAWAISKGHDLAKEDASDGYFYSDANEMWEAWQAARRAPVATDNHREFANAQKAQPAEFAELMWQNIDSLYAAEPHPPSVDHIEQHLEMVSTPVQLPELSEINSKNAHLNQCSEFGCVICKQYKRQLQDDREQSK